MTDELLRIRTGICRSRPGNNRVDGGNRPDRGDRGGSVPGHGQEIGRFQRLVNPSAPCRRLPTPFMVSPTRTSPTHRRPREVLPEFLAFLGDAGHDRAAGPQRLVRRRLSGPRAGSGRLAGSDAFALRHAGPGAAAAAAACQPPARLSGSDPRASTPPAPHRALADSLRVKEIWLCLTALGIAAALVSYRMFDPK